MKKEERKGKEDRRQWRFGEYVESEVLLFEMMRSEKNKG
jgi:hypothetical protein